MDNVALQAIALVTEVRYSAACEDCRLPDGAMSNYPTSEQAQGQDAINSSQSYLQSRIYA